MSEQDKPAGEWTAMYVHNVTGAPMPRCELIADAHNAALAAEREKAEYSLELYEQCVAALAAEQENAQQQLDTCFKHELELEKKLEAEREKYDLLMMAAKTDAGIAEQQLAAEREKYIELCDRANGDLIEANKELAAERERLENDEVQRLRDLAMEIVDLKTQLAAEREKYEAACEGRDQYKAQLSDADKQLAAATAREMHSYDVAKLCRDELAAAVEALKEILSVKIGVGFQGVATAFGRVNAIANAALAKVKQ